jgi:hypothetical protein
MQILPEKSLLRGIYFRPGVGGQCPNLAGHANPIKAPNPLTTALSIFSSNMQDKIMNART